MKEVYNDSGCVFSIDTVGNNYNDLLDFTYRKGTLPKGSLILSKNLLYGMTSTGGSSNNGCIFSIDTNGTNYKDEVNFNKMVKILGVR